MYKDKSKQRQANKEAMRKKRVSQGITEATSEGITKGGQGITGPVVIRRLAVKLVDPVWRDRIERISESLGSLASEVRLDGITMPTWRMLLDVVSI